MTLIIGGESTHEQSEEKLAEADLNKYSSVLEQVEGVNSQASPIILAVISWILHQICLKQISLLCLLPFLFHRLPQTSLSIDLLCF